MLIARKGDTKTLRPIGPVKPKNLPLWPFYIHYMHEKLH